MWCKCRGQGTCKVSEHYNDRNKLPRRILVRVLSHQLCLDIPRKGCENNELDRNFFVIHFLDIVLTGTEQNFCLGIFYHLNPSCPTKSSPRLSNCRSCASTELSTCSAAAIEFILKADKIVVFVNVLTRTWIKLSDLSGRLVQGHLKPNLKEVSGSDANCNTALKALLR